MEEKLGVAAKQLLERVIEQTAKERGAINMTADGADFGDFAGVQRYARLLIEAGVVKQLKGETSPQQHARAIMCIMLGRRVGIPPEEAVQSIYIVNWRAHLFGQAPLAVARKHPDWVESGYEEYFEVDGTRVDGDPEPDAFQKDSTRCVVKTLRKGAKDQKIHSFSMAHAKAAHLVGKEGSLYPIYPQRMLRFRARGFALNDNFGDALKGLNAAVDMEPPETETAETKPAEPQVGRTNLRDNTKTALPTPAASEVSRVPGEPEPTATPSQPSVVDEAEELILEDAMLDLRERLKGCSTERDFADALKDLQALEKHFGHSRYIRLLEEYQDHYDSWRIGQSKDMHPAAAGQSAVLAGDKKKRNL
jgi:hypothetical protein